MNANMLVNMILNQNPNLKNNPMVNNALNMAMTGNTQGLSMMLQNICNERGIDLNGAMNEIKKYMK